MAEITIDSFKETLDVLVDANPHARNKGDDFKAWAKENFNCDARISFIKEQRQITNRVSEQFRYFAPIVIFVCVSDVKRDTLVRYILERVYTQLENVAIIGATINDGGKNYTFEQLIVFKQTSFTEWATPHFSQVYDGKELMTNLGIGASEDGLQDLSVLESERKVCGDNILLYGVPGSGKSWTIEHEYRHKHSIIERLVFHPDYTNADFIGQILPVVDEDKQVTYEFSPGPFTLTIREAYYRPKDEFILVIEEVNRGNAPAIFGEAFQLLDRIAEDKEIDGVLYKAGTSEYGVTHKNMAEFIYGDSKRKVRIPANLSIIGTMNTSDQNVFTLDTAFQRRWKMRLIENSFDNVRPSLANCLILDTGVTWRRFCETINKQIVGNKAKMASSEDKRLGVYFVHESDLKHNDADEPVNHASLLAELNELLKAEMIGNLSEEQDERLREIRAALMQNRIFPEKVIKYLWDDAFKFNTGAIFDTEENKDLDSLEAVIRMFVYENKGKDRFRVFKSSIRDLLFES